MGSFLRKPLGAFVATLVIGAALLGVGMTAFGGTSGSPYYGPKPLTPAQFRHAGLRFCLAYRPQLLGIANMKKPKNLREVAKDSRKITALTDSMTGFLDRVLPPRSAAASYRRVLFKFHKLDHAIDRLNHLAQTRQWGQLVLLVRSKWWKNIGKLFGKPTNPKHIPPCRQPTRGTFA
jgi:hypothetical protein